MILLTLIALSCPQVKMQNTTKYPWNQFDKETLARAKNRCGKIYQDAPCVKLFKKYDKQDYSVVCGN